MTQEEFESTYEPIERKGHSPFFRLVAGFAAIALFLLSIRGYFYFIHPAPRMNLELSDIQNLLPSDLQEPFTSHRADDVRAVLDDAEGNLKQAANRIASSSCKSGDRVCQSKALFNFVRDQIVYVPDAQFHDQLENPLVTLKTGGADCEDMSILLGGLQKAIGNESRLVFVPGHVYTQVKIPDYKNQWLNMEATCKTCSFNEIPTDTLLQKKRYVEL